MSAALSKIERLACRLLARWYEWRSDRDFRVGRWTPCSRAERMEAAERGSLRGVFRADACAAPLFLGSD